MPYFYQIHHFIFVESDVDLNLPCFRVEGLAQEANLVVKLSERTAPAIKDYVQFQPGLFFNKKRESLLSYRKVFGMDLLWELKGLTQPRTTLIISPLFLRASHFIFPMPIGSVHPFRDILAILLQVKLLQMNASFMIGGAIRKNNKNIIFCGTHGSGKTTLTQTFLGGDNQETLAISDDRLIVQDGLAYSYPTLIKKRKLHFVIASYSKFYHPEKDLGQQFVPRSELKGELYFLETSAALEKVPLSLNEMVSKVMTINNRVFSFFHERLFSLASYVYSELDALTLLDRQRSILTNCLASMDGYILRAGKISEFTQFIDTGEKNVKSFKRDEPTHPKLPRTLPKAVFGTD